MVPAIFSLATLISYYMAINTGPVAYVSAVRRLAVLFSMVTGVVLFREKTGWLGISGSIIMISGSAVICIWG
jgi:drug/metabolite transporter (DMT)-like permease